MSKYCRGKIASKRMSQYLLTSVKKRQPHENTSAKKKYSN